MDQDLPNLPAALQAPVDACLSALPPAVAVAVAVSGGPDSVALAVAAARAARAQGRALHLLHVHHGLMADADAWAAGVQALARRLGAAVAVRQVDVLPAGQGVEDAARAARYAALAELARAAGVAAVLLAHHQDDQAETILMRLLRGAGVGGVGGMRAHLARDGVHYLRCWLDVPRADILAGARGLASALGVLLADDPSNLDPRYARGHLRAQVLPALAAHWPGYRATLARFGRLAREADAILAEVAAEDLARVGRELPGHGQALVVSAWRRLTPARRQQALRAWLAAAGLPMPTEARLSALSEQMLHARADRQVRVEHGGATLRLYRDVLLRVAPDVPAAAAAPDAAPIELQWRGEPCLALPALGGSLHFEPAAVGASVEWLSAQPLRVGLRRGRERLRVSPEGPSRSLKNLFQERGVPAWERARLPLVWRGQTLIYVAGLGPDARVPMQPGGMRLRWQADSPGATIGAAHDNQAPNAG